MTTSQRGPASTVLICSGLALLGLGFVVSNAALALVPGLVLIVVGFTVPVPVFFKHREADGESEGGGRAQHEVEDDDHHRTLMNSEPQVCGLGFVVGGGQRLQVVGSLMTTVVLGDCDRLRALRRMW